MNQANMKLRRWSLAIFALAVLVAVATNQAVSMQTGDEAAVREALLKSASSFEKNDMAAATEVWVNDDSNGIRKWPRELRLGGLSRPSSRARDGRDEEHEVLVQRYEDSSCRQDGLG